MERPGVLNVSLARYRASLGETQKKKFQNLAELADLHVVAFSREGPFRRVEAGARFYLLPLIPTAFLRFKLLCLYALFLGYRLSGSGHVSIVLSQGPYEALPGLLLRWLGRLRGRRLVLVTELHGDWEESPFLYQRIPSLAPLRWSFRKWGSFVLKRSDLIRAASRFLEKKAGELAPDVPCIVFPAFTDMDLFHHEPAPGDAVVHAPPVLTFVGGLYPVKGVSVLLRAMKAVVASEPEARLQVVGEGPLRSRLEEEAAELEVKEHVVFRGPLSQADVAAELMRSRALVLPSLSEGMGLVVPEAMSCGLPVVASDVGGIPELVVDGETGFLVSPGDETALAERILWILRHRKEAEALGNRGRERVKERFSTQTYVDGYRELFTRAMALLSPGGDIL